MKKKGMIKLTASAITAGIIASAICSDNIIIEYKEDSKKACNRNGRKI